MKGFKVVALTKKGEKALREQKKEFEAQPIHIRLLTNRFFKIEYLKKSETMIFEIKNPHIAAMLDPNDFINKIIVGFMEKDCVDQVDFMTVIF